ncbi:hypothetical protein ACJRO7_023377 [Eucalyptus globulus]|uniref:Uncharacterized protein n=1 Tax=Eucalyptus globulus TaxID=34317 RepID=A0ABD3K1N9_EUCGL
MCCVFAFWNTRAASLFFSGRLGFIMVDSGEAKQAEPGNLEETSEKQTSEQAFSGSYQEIRISGSGMVEEDDDEDSKTESLVLHNQKKPQRTGNKLYFSTGSSKSSVSAESTFDSDK